MTLLEGFSRLKMFHLITWLLVLQLIRWTLEAYLHQESKTIRSLWDKFWVEWIQQWTSRTKTSALKCQTPSTSRPRHRWTLITSATNWSRHCSLFNWTTLTKAIQSCHNFNNSSRTRLSKEKETTANRARRSSTALLHSQKPKTQ